MCYECVHICNPLRASHCLRANSTPFWIDDFSSGIIFAMPARSYAFIGPSGSTPSAPCRPSRTLNNEQTQ